MRFALLALASLILAVSFAPTTSAAPPVPPVPPLAGVCVDDVTHTGCYGGNWICVTFSYQVPKCVEHQPVTCTEICDPCMTIQCDVPAPCTMIDCGVVCSPETCSPCTKLDVCDFIQDLVTVCIAGTTHPSCYDFRDVCIEISDMVPVCFDTDIR